MRAPSSEVLDALEDVIIEVRSWRYSHFPHVPRGMAGAMLTAAHKNLHPRDKQLITAIDGYDRLAMIEEPMDSVLIRARAALNDYAKHGLQEIDRIRLLRWLDGEASDAQPDDRHTEGAADGDAEGESVRAAGSADPILE